MIRHRFPPLLELALLAAASLAVALPASARLGQSKARCDALYGAPVQKNPDGSLLYVDGAYAFVVFFANGVCDEMFVLKPDAETNGEEKKKLATDDVARLLDDNRPSPDHSWQPVQMQSGYGMGWKTDDSEYEAYLLPGSEQMNISTAIAATARRMELPRTASAPKPAKATTERPENAAPVPGDAGTKVETIFSEDEMTYYHLAFGARKISDHETVIASLKSLYELIRKEAGDDASRANSRFGFFFSWLGDAYDQTGNPLMALRCYQRFLEEFPLGDGNMRTTIAVANNLTWILATHVDPNIRAPEVAFGYAQEMEKLEDIPEPCHDTIAVAYAAVGKFDEALAKLDAVAETTRDPDLLRVLSQHRRLFQANTPYIEDPKR